MSSYACCQEVPRHHVSHDWSKIWKHCLINSRMQKKKKLVIDCIKNHNITIEKTQYERESDENGRKMTLNVALQMLTGMTEVWSVVVVFLLHPAVIISSMAHTSHRTCGEKSS